MLRAEGVSAETAARWEDEAAGWFDEAWRAVPGAEGDRRVALVAEDVVAKREVVRGWKRALVAAGLRRYRSERAFEVGVALARAGIAAAVPLACIVEPRGAAGEAVLVMRRAEGCSLWTYVAQKKTIPSPHPPRGHAPGTAPRGDGCADSAAFPSPSPDDPTLATLADALAALHAAGFRHRDLKAPNVFVSGPPPRVRWLDLDGIARRAVVSDAVRTRDLARLCASFASPEARAAGIDATAAWPAFVARYVRSARGGDPAPEALARAVDATRRWAARHREHNARRGRPTA